MRRAFRRSSASRPTFIPDFLALVGDSSDGYPGLPGIGPKTAARLIGQHGHLEQFPASVLGENRERALLFKKLATLRTDAPLFDDVEQLRWRGPARHSASWRRKSATRGSPKERSLGLYSILMTRKHCLILVGVLLAAVAHAQKPPNTAATALHALFDREWEWELTQDPLWASYLGDRRWNDRWQDISPAALAARHAHRESC